MKWRCFCTCHDREDVIRYIVIIITVLLFVILYMWQNIEVMRIKLDYAQKLKRETRLIRDNDLIRYEIEMNRRIDVIEKAARERGLEKISLRHFDVVNLSKKKQ